MSFTTPKTWHVGEPLNAADLNTNAHDNVAALGTAVFVTARRTASTTITDTAKFNEVTFTRREYSDGTDHVSETVSPFTALSCFAFGLWEVALQVTFPTGAEDRRVAIGLTRVGNFSSTVATRDVRQMASASSVVNVAALIDLGNYTTAESFTDTSFTFFAHVEDITNQSDVDIEAARMTVTRVGVG